MIKDVTISEVSIQIVKLFNESEPARVSEIMLKLCAKKGKVSQYVAFNEVLLRQQYMYLTCQEVLTTI